ncbi:penicillin-binding protein 2 [Candidatus Azambacteria bacterium]|nr:penicillin-binding protein 2 [Candidatus Azambacteria bacterium]
MIEPEEILLDKNSAEKLDDSKLVAPINKKVFAIFFIFVIFVFFVFIARAAELQVFKHQEYSLLADGNKTRSYPILANRGVIYDRNMNQLVYNVPSFDLVAIPANLPKNKLEREEEFVNVASQFNLEKDEILNKFKKPDMLSLTPVLIKENVQRDEALFMESHIGQFAGIELKKNSTRDYKDGKIFANILGYTGKVSDKDLFSNTSLSSLDYIGKTGIEFFYDSSLRGQNGRIIQYVDSVLNLKKEKRVKDDLAGNSVILSIDADLQNIIYEEIANQLRVNPTAEGASAVAVNPKTGEILALVSSPSYDNNIFSKGGSKDEYKKLLDDNLKPMFNRPVAGTYSPGSAIKPFMASAGLEEGVITKDTKIHDTGYIAIQNQYDPSIVYTFKDWKAGGHGIISVKDALAVSSNVFFYTLGGGYGDIVGLGMQRMKKYLNLFGFGNDTGIDINSEEAGIIPDPEWKKKVKGEDWYTGDTYISAIGQGNMLVTPLQLAMATSAIANGGTLLKPYLVKSIMDKNDEPIYETAPKQVRSGFIKEENLQTVREGMRMAVTVGSAHRLANLPIKIAGKTGTAQIGGNDTHAWFTSFAPYDDPEIALTIMIEKGGEGSGAAVPVAKEVYKRYFKIQEPAPIQTATTTPA